jgi:hypothetical protein
MSDSSSPVVDTTIREIARPQLLVIRAWSLSARWIPACAMPAHGLLGIHRD